MRKDRLPAGPGDPAKRLRERCPRMRHITGLSAHEIALERVMNIAYVTRLREKTREVRTRNEPFAGHVLTGACERVRYAGVLKRVGDLLRSSVAARPNRCETFTQRLIFGIDAQCEDVQRVFFPGDRKLRAWDELDSFLRGSGAGFRQTVQLVVIGERENVNAVRGGPTHDVRRRQHTIGACRMTMKIVFDHTELR